VTDGGTVQVKNQIQIEGGSPADGKVLTSTDVNGLAEWRDPSSGMDGHGTDNHLVRWNGTDKLQDSNVFVADNGNVGIGTMSPTGPLHTAGEGYYANVFEVATSSYEYWRADLEFRRARGTLLAKQRALNNDDLGLVRFSGYDGSDYEVAVDIRAEVDGVSGTNDMPGRLQFRTTPDGSNTPLARMTIKNYGSVGIGTENPDANALLDVAGKIKIVDGTQGSGKVLTSDPNGLASWQSPGSADVNINDVARAAGIAFWEINNVNNNPCSSGYPREMADSDLSGSITGNTICANAATSCVDVKRLIAWGSAGIQQSDNQACTLSSAKDTWWPYTFMTYPTPPDIYYGGGWSAYSYVACCAVENTVENKNEYVSGDLYVAREVYVAGTADANKVCRSDGTNCAGSMGVRLPNMQCPILPAGYRVSFDTCTLGTNVDTFTNTQVKVGASYYYLLTNAPSPTRFCQDLGYSGANGVSCFLPSGTGAVWSTTNLRWQTASSAPSGRCDQIGCY
ncbi:MAG: hypothetical protein ABIE94_03615, partial [archaeon]